MLSLSSLRRVAVARVAVACAVTSGAAVGAACGPDPAALVDIDHRRPEPAQADGADAATDDAPPSTEHAGSGSGSSDGDGKGADDAGASASHDGAAEAGNAGSVFTGAPAYVETLGTSARNTTGHTTNPDGNAAGTACLTCHQVGGAATPFLVAGTLWADAAGTLAAAKVEVRVRDATGASLVTYSDGDGNFFLARGDAGAIAAPARAGIRTAANQQPMGNVINNGDCNACHQAAGSPGRLHLL
jgi:hypothetical protein